MLGVWSTLDAKEIIHREWDKHILGSPMFKISRKCSNIRYGLFNWCESFQIKHNISWKDMLSCYDQTQVGLESHGHTWDEHQMIKGSIWRDQIQ